MSFCVENIVPETCQRHRRKKGELKASQALPNLTSWRGTTGRGAFGRKKVRTISIENDRITMMLKKMLAKTNTGHKLLVSDDISTDKAIHRLEIFIYNHRAEIQDADDDRPLTFHGLRHTYAAEKYKSLLDGGVSALDAHFAVSRLLGHERADVTDIYLASVKKKGGADGK